ncbi:ABC transporter ATP-binding protein [candidate division KSB1 bacterium]
MLQLKNVETGYSNKKILFDISMEAKKGEIIALIGPNGAGKSTVLKVISGILKAWKGEIFFNQIELNSKKTSDIVKCGISYCPQDDSIFDELTVMENLEMGGVYLNKQELDNRIETILEKFHIIKQNLKKVAGVLSGGEQQILGIARALIPEPEFILLDEPSRGLTPSLADSVFNKIAELKNDLNIGFLIVEQRVLNILDISSKTYSLKLGKISYEGSPNFLIDNPEKIKELFL